MRALSSAAWSAKGLPTTAAAIGPFTLATAVRQPTPRERAGVRANVRTFTFARIAACGVADQPRAGRQGERPDVRRTALPIPKPMDVRPHPRPDLRSALPGGEGGRRPASVAFTARTA